MDKMKIFFLVTIDTECDKSFDWSVQQPLSFRSIIEGIPQRLQPLFNMYQVKPTYLLSPEVILNSDSVKILKNMPGECELGTHLHAEFIDPGALMNSSATKVFQADYSYEIEFNKMKNLTELFESAFGYSPVSFRAGRFGMGKNTLSILKKLGYLIDSSVFPLHTIVMKNSINNFYDAPHTVYFPDMSNYRREIPSDEAGLLEIPVTVYSSFYNALPVFVRRPMSERAYLLALAKRLLGKRRVKPITLRPSSLSFDEMKFVVDRSIECNRKNGIVFLTMMFHSNEIIEGASPYCISTEEVQKLLQSMNSVFQYVQDLDGRFISMSDAWHIMKKTDSRIMPVPFIDYKV